MSYQGMHVLLVAVYCMNTLTRLHIAAQVTKRTCACSVGYCDFSKVCSPTPNCTRENVALGKPANVSSLRGNDLPSGLACVVVNGNTDTTYYENNRNCILTGENDRNAYWLVNLGRNYTINNITVYFWVFVSIVGIDFVSIKVDGQTCYQFSTNTPASQLQKDVTCNPPRRGSVVKFERNSVNQGVFMLAICEVQVWVCTPGLYGINCDNKCNCKEDEICDNFYGTCILGCKGRFYGSNCTQECGHCNETTTCDFQTGKCLNGCMSGWQEPMCTVCREGLYGSNCTLICGNCKERRTCDFQTGQCLNGCRNGWQEPMCTVCREELYGSNCTQICGNCKEIRTCDFQTGHCLDGCRSRWQEPMCTDCKTGFHGTDCNISCGFCKDSQPCIRENGTCVGGCADGFKAPDCIEKCPSGTWGGECQHICGACLEYACRHDNGTCEKGCILGHEGGKCEVLLQQDRDLTGPIVGSVLGAGLVISVSVIIAVLIWLRRTSRKANLSQPKVTYDASEEMHSVQDLHFQEDVYDKFETEEDVARPYTVRQKESHDENDILPTALENNYENLTPQYQNSSDDSKPYEVLAVSSK